MCARAGRQGILVGVTGRRRGPFAACVRGCNAHGEAGGEACDRSLLSRLPRCRECNRHWREELE
eukprot:5464036-Prymnesium_polylepis.1